jgi:hypothetical protein
MYARVLFAWPPEPAYAVLNDEANEIEPDIQNIIMRVNKLAVLVDDKLVIGDIPLSDEARREFVQFLQFAHQGKRALEGREREWFAKMTAHVLRLAGALAHLEWAIDIDAAKPEQITHDCMTSAIKLVRDYFWPHARACLRQIGLTERHANARRVLRWLKANASVGEISVKDIRRDALAQTLDAKQTEELLDGLARAGWLKRKPAEPTGGRAIHRWSVNPFLYSEVESAQSAERFASPIPRGLSALPALSAIGSEGVICAQCGAGPASIPPSDSPTVKVKNGNSVVWVHAIGCHRTWIEDHRQ